MILTDKQHQQIHFYLLVLFCFFLVLLPRISVFAIIGITLNGLAGGYLWRRPKIAFGPWPLLFLSFFALHLVGMLYTNNLAEGFGDLETKLSFLVLPILLFAVPISYENGRAIILRAFVAGCLLATLYAYGNAGVLFLRTGLNGFYYKYLSAYVNTHPTYLAIYLNFGLFLLLEELLRNLKSLSRNGKLIRMVLMVHFLLFIFLLTARMQLLLLVFLLALSFVWYMSRRGKLRLGLLGLFIGLTLAGTLAWLLPTTKNRIVQAYQEFHDPEAEPNIRILIWNEAIGIIGEAPLIGQGTGDVQDALEAAYHRKQIKEAMEANYNAHNQYLQTGMALGIPGLLLLLANLFAPLWITLQRKKYIYAFFLSLMILSMLTECILETQKGILFFVFFNCFLALGLNTEDQ